MTERNDAGDITIAAFQVEHRRDALGIGTPQPRLSWTVATSAADWRQSAYAIEAYGPDGVLRDQTGKVASDQSVLVAWPFAPLGSRERCTVRVQVWGNDGSPSAWSAPVAIEVGLLEPGDWTARFVTPDWDDDTSIPQPSPLLRRAFDVRDGAAQARLYVTALGVYEAHINGVIVGDEVLAPGWTSYSHRLRYQIFDVTGMLKAGQNAIGATLGEGWYSGRLGFGKGQRNIYGDRLGLLAQLEITYADGSSERIVTDANWRAARGPIVASEIYDGERYDAQLERPGWSTADYDDSDWSGVRLLDHNLATLFAPIGPPVRRIEELLPVAIATSPSGRTIVDFGQNVVGWVRLTVQGATGQTVTLRHAEVLENGELSIRPLRYAKATDSYTLRGGEAETWEPHFTFHGFRYVDVEGWPGTVQADDLRAIVCHSDMERTGWFECSEPLINRLHENVVWGMRGNFFDIPTDCPQRDERLGWTGDIQVFSPTASFLYDSAGFLESWLGDLAAEQRAAGGVVAPTIPNVIPGLLFPAAAWGDAATVVPWVLYGRFGDAGLLAKQFDSMRAWVDVVDKIAGESHLWDTGFQFGDWLDPDAPPDNPAAAKTHHHIVATAYLARSAEIVGQAASVLGRTEDQAHYKALADQVRAAFNAEYVTPVGRMLSDATTGYALALEFGLIRDASQRQRAGERLATLVRNSGYLISTGFVGTPLICDALCSVGAYDTAYRLLTQRACPSWLYPVTMGATTVWERWDSMLPDGTVNPGEMTSFNHYALGAVADWLHRTVAGLVPAAPGYKQVAIAPHPGGGLTNACARHRTPYGIAECAWEIADGQLAVTAIIPPNTSALVTLPGAEGKPIEVGSGTHHWSVPYNVPQPTRRPLSVDSLMGEVLADADAWGITLPILLRTMGELRGLEGSEHRTVRQAFGFLPQSAPMIAEIDAALAAIPFK